MTGGPRTRAGGESMLVLANLALVAVVLLPAYLVAAAVLDLLYAGGDGSLADRLVHHARDRWWVPLIWLLCAPFVMALLRWLARSRPELPLRRIAIVSAPLAYAALFLFFFAASAPTSGALARALVPGVVAVLAYAAAMRLPIARGKAPTGTRTPAR